MLIVCFTGHRLWTSSCSGHNHQPLGNAAGWDGTDREAEMLQGPSHCRINVSMKGVFGSSLACMQHVVYNFLPSILSECLRAWYLGYPVMISSSVTFPVGEQGCGGGLFPLWFTVHLQHLLAKALFRSSREISERKCPVNQCESPNASLQQGCCL